jgi:hypothetical protein
MKRLMMFGSSLVAVMVAFGGSQAQTPTGLKIVDNRDARYTYTLTASGTDAKGAAFNDLVKTTLVSRLSDKSHHLMVEGATLPKLIRVRDDRAFRIGQLDSYLIAGKAFVSVELPDGSVVCRPASGSDLKLINQYAAVAVISKYRSAYEVLLKSTPVAKKQVAGMNVTSYYATGTGSDLLSMDITDKQQIIELTAMLNGAVDFFGQKINGGVLISFQSEFEDITPIRTPEECTSTPGEYKLGQG